MLSRFTFFLGLIFCIMIGCDQNSDEHGLTVSASARSDADQKVEYALAIHGGAGVILKENMTDEREKSYRDALNYALDVGESILKKGGTASEAVIATIKTMEDNALFNAGHGAVFTNDGRNELDASIMEGQDLNAGSIGGVTNVRNPIEAAYAVLKHSNHVLLTGKGAERFAEEQGLHLVDPDYFYTERRWQSLQKAKDSELKKQPVSADTKHGTVGAVALDKYGNLTAGTSTGGMTNKRYNRFGDVPIIGAGTYANNATCAISCTGHGEFFIRYTVGHDISALMEYKGLSIGEAAEEVVLDKLVNAGGSGGIIGVDKQGNIALTFNSPGMYRGYVKPGERSVKIYGDDEADH